MLDINKQVLTQNAAGMRLIVLMTLYNSANFPRLKTYIADSYHPSLVEEQPVSAHLAVLKAQRRLSGKTRIRQMIAIDKYQVVVLMESEHDRVLTLVDLAVEEEYPHLITRFNQSQAG